MKKFLALLIVFISLPFGGWAGGTQYKASDDFVCAESNADSALNNYQGKAQFTIYFDTGSHSAHSGCDAQYANIRQQLAGLQDNVSEFVLIGSADEQNASGDYDNRALAERRIDYVSETVLPSAPAWRKYVAGDENAKTYSKSIDNQRDRAVDIYIIWRMPTCDILKRGRTDIENALKACKMTASKELQDCFNGKQFTATADENLQKFWVEMFKTCPALKGISDGLGWNVEMAYNKVSKFYDGLGLTVWRNEDGDFNTARLASDSIAAVVLGTAGGIITSKIVKKNQIKQGFEDLNCSIGGQRVAGFGDEFTVGLR